MSEPIPAYIAIGGKVTKEQAEQIVIFCDDYGLTDDCESSCITTIDELEDEIDEDGVLKLYNHQANYGMFPDLQAWLESQKIPYDLHADGKYEYDPEITEYRPSLGEAITRKADHSGDEVIDANVVRKALTLIADGEAVKAVELLREELGPEVEPLPPFEVVEAAAAVG